MPRSLTSGSKVKARGDGAQHEARGRHYTLPSLSSALITWRPQGWERRLSLWVDDRSQGGSCFNVGTSVARDNRLATSVYTHFFDSCSAAAVGRQERWTQRLFTWLAKGGGRWKTSRATVEHGERVSCAEKRTGEATYARGRKCENTLELQGGDAPAESPVQFMLSARESTLDYRRCR